jgi:hypothetical protein
MRWRSGEPAIEKYADSQTYLVLENASGDPIEVAMVMGEDGWTVSFHVGISAERSLRDVEDFVVRCRRFLLDEPVVPS